MPYEVHKNWVLKERPNEKKESSINGALRCAISNSFSGRPKTAIFLGMERADDSPPTLTKAQSYFVTSSALESPNALQKVLFEYYISEYVTRKAPETHFPQRTNPCGLKHRIQAKITI